MLIAVLAIILGEMIALLTGEIRWILLLAVLAVIVKIITKMQGAFFVVIFLFCTIGFLNMDRGIQQQEQMEQLCEEKAGIQVEVQGRVSGMQETSYGYRMIVSDVVAEGIEQDKVLVSLKEKPRAKIGQTIRMKGTFCPISPAENFGNFDGKEYYRSLEI